MLGIQSDLLGAAATGYPQPDLHYGRSAEDGQLSGCDCRVRRRRDRPREHRAQLESRPWISAATRSGSEDRIRDRSGRESGLPNIDEEIRRFEYKVEAGAEYAVTQPVFDLALLEKFLKRIEHCRVPVVAGIWPLVSVRNAEFMKNELRVSVPDSIVSAWRKRRHPEHGAAGRVWHVAREMLIAVREIVQGAQISAPNGKYAAAVDVLEALGDKTSRQSPVAGRWREQDGGATGRPTPSTPA